MSKSSQNSQLQFTLPEPLRAHNRRQQRPCPPMRAAWWFGQMRRAAQEGWQAPPSWRTIRDAAPTQ